MAGVSESPGPYIDPKWKGSYDKDTHKNDPQFVETVSLVF